jgi:hypothetical protein
MVVMTDADVIRILLRDDLKTEESRRKLVESMVSPDRCGGLDYAADGKPVYRHENPDLKDPQP